MSRKTTNKPPKRPRSRGGMYRFLVMGRSKSDDVPLQSFRTAQEAYDYPPSDRSHVQGGTFR